MNQAYQALTKCAKSLVNQGIPGKSGKPGYSKKILFYWKSLNELKFLEDIYIKLRETELVEIS